MCVLLHSDINNFEDFLIGAVALSGIIVPVFCRDMRLRDMSNFLDKCAYDHRSKIKDRDVRLLSKSKGWQI